jgi:ABC-2 type transport system ATP-binding protein
MADAIRVEGLTKHYGELAAVDGISFRVPPGQVFAFLDPNGAGKTTTVEILEGLRHRTTGSVEVLGLDPWKEGRALHRQIGVIPQEFRFFERITPLEAIAYYSDLFDRPVDAQELLARVELSDKGRNTFETLSGGQKQKLGLALALVNDPKITFLDEPTTGLDPHARRSIWEVIRGLQAAGTTIFLTTHYLEEAQLLADQVAIINHGRIIAEGTPSEIIRKHGRPGRVVIEGPRAVADLLERTLGCPVRYSGTSAEFDLRSKEDVLRALSALDAGGVPWTSVSTRSETLEDVFVALVGTMDDGALKAEGSA